MSSCRMWISRLSFISPPPFPLTHDCVIWLRKWVFRPSKAYKKLNCEFLVKLKLFRHCFLYLCSSLVRGLLCLSKDKYTQRRCKCTEIRGGQQLFPDGQREHWHSERCPLKIDHSAEKLPVKKIIIFHFFVFFFDLKSLISDQMLNFIQGLQLQ